MVARRFGRARMSLSGLGKILIIVARSSLAKPKGREIAKLCGVASACRSRLNRLQVTTFNRIGKNLLGTLRALLPMSLTLCHNVASRAVNH